MKNKINWFTLIELLIVIMIIGILASITLQLNRGQIGEMEALNDKENWLSRHKRENTIITNTNFMQKTKITTWIQYIYSNWNSNVNMIINGINTTWYQYKNHTISWNLIITKNPLQLWCNVTIPNKIEIISKNKVSCFTINTSLCSIETCE